MASKLKSGDNVVVIAGKNKGKEGKILYVDRKKNRIIVEGVNLISRHQKPNAMHQSGGIIKKEATIDMSNVMYMHNGKPVRVGFKVTEKDGKKIKNRIAKPSGEVID